MKNRNIQTKSDRKVKHLIPENVYYLQLNLFAENKTQSIKGFHVSLTQQSTPSYSRILYAI